MADVVEAEEAVVVLLVVVDVPGRYNVIGVENCVITGTDVESLG